MSPIEHLEAILKGRICPETADWLRDGVLRAIAGDMPLERCLGLRGRIKPEFLRQRRDTNLAEGANRIGSVARYLDAYTAWMDDQPVADQGALEDLFNDLLVLEAHGARLPGARQARRTVAKLVK